MFKVIRNKYNDKKEAEIIDKWAKILEPHFKNENQNKLKNVLPLFLENTCNDIRNVINNNLSNNYNYPFDIIITRSLISTFSKLNIKGNTFDVCDKQSFIGLYKGKNRILNTEDYKLNFHVNISDIYNNNSYILDELYNYLQGIVDTYKTIVLYKLNCFITVNEDMSQCLTFIFKLCLLDKINSTNNLIKDETEYLLSSTENERRLNIAVKELGGTVKSIKEQPDNIDFIGYYEIRDIEGLQINVKKRPNWLKRKMLKLFFNIKWHDRT